MRRWLVACRLTLVPGALASQAPTDTLDVTPVVVTATRLPTRVDAVTAAVTVLTGVELRALGLHTVFEALRDIPTAAVVQTGSFGGQTSLFLRGGQSNYVKVLVDGVPVNDPGGAFDFASLTTDNVERIEVVRGPGSVLYGSDAVTGVVQILTRRGIGVAGADASVWAGTYGTFDSDVRASGGGARASYSFAASRFTSGGTYAFNNHYSNTVASALVRVAPDDRTDATLSLRYDDHTYHFPTDGAGNPVDHNQYNYGSGPTIGLDLGHYFTPRIEARLLLTDHATRGGFDDRPDSAADSTLFHSLDRLRRAGADLRLNLHLPAGTVLTAGTAVEQEYDASSNVCQTSFGDCSSPPIDTSRWNGAMYGQAVADVARRVSLTAGVRLEDNQRFGTYATYRVGAVYRVARGTRIRAGAGTGFREPTFFENFATGFSVGNPNLRPEHSRSWEVGVEQAIHDRATLAATVFEQHFVDMIDYNPSAPSGTPNYANVGGAVASGVELTVGLPLRLLSLAATYTYLHTDVTNPGFDATPGAALAPGQPLLRRPRHSARVSAAHGFPRRGSVTLTVAYVGARADQDFSTFPFPRVTLPSYTRVDAAGECDLVKARGSRPGLTLSGRVENLLDQRHDEVKNFPARRRTLLFGGRLTLGR